MRRTHTPHKHTYARTFAHTCSHMPNVMVVVINSTVYLYSAFFYLPAIFLLYEWIHSYFFLIFLNAFFLEYSPLYVFVVACAWQTWFIFPMWVFSTHSFFLFLSRSLIWCQINQFNAPLNLSTQQNRCRCCYRFCWILCSLFQAI